MQHPPNARSGIRLSDAQAQAVLQASLDAIFVMDAQGVLRDVNGAAEAILGRDAAALIGQPAAETILPEGERAAFLEGIAQYLAKGQSPIVGRRVDMQIARADGATFPAEVVIFAAPGAPPVFIGFIRDVSAQKAAQAHSAFLLNELAHRGGNLLAVAQTIVNRTLRDHPVRGAREIIASRIGALARAHASLAGGPAGAPLRKIVKDELAGFSNLIVVEGPDIVLNASAAQTMALVVHELATNAVKYGALSSESGAVHVRWRESGGPALFVFEWFESGGPEVAPPTRTGFGRVVLEKIAAAEFNATPRLDFLPAGLTYRFG